MDGQQQQVTEKQMRKVPKYKQLSIEEKIELIAVIEKGEKKSVVAKRYNITCGAITKILRQKEKYNIQGKNLKLQKKKTRIDKGKNDKLEELLFDWLKQKRSLGICITGPLLKEKALFFNEQLDGPITFKASQGWLTNFKNRFGMHQLSVQGEKLSGDTDGASAFKEEIQEIITEGGYSLDNVYNADETGLYVKSLPQRTLVLVEEKQAPGYKESKERVTIMNCSNATGTHKVPLLLIGKSGRPRCFKNVMQLPVVYRGQKNAWMNSDIFTDWYKNVFIASVKERKSSETDKLLLILDNAPCHPSVNFLNAIDPQFRVVFLPPNVTALVQPMDQGVIESMKKHYKAIFLRALVLSETVESQDIKTFYKNWNLLDTASAVASAWTCVPQSSLTKAWKNFIGQPSLSDVNGDQSMEITTILNNIHGSNTYSISDVQEWTNEDCQLPTCQNISDREFVSRFLGSTNVKEEAPNNEDDSEIADSSINSDSESTQDAECELPIQENVQSMIDMYSHFQMFKKFYQSVSDCNKEGIVSLNSIQYNIQMRLYNLIYNND